jgi:hypothetical protein
MPISWQASAEVFAEILRRHGVEPDAVSDVDAAWGAFDEFLQIDLDGIVEEPDSDADGFIIQWGRYSWNGGRLSLAFTRQLAVTDGEGQKDPDSQPALWQVDLEMCFDDEPDLIGLDTLNSSDTGFSFDPIGPQRTAELAEMRTDMERHPQLQAIWSATPVSSSLSFECVC